MKQARHMELKVRVQYTSDTSARGNRSQGLIGLVLGIVLGLPTQRCAPWHNQHYLNLRQLYTCALYAMAPRGGKFIDRLSLSHPCFRRGLVAAARSLRDGHIFKLSMFSKYTTTELLKP
jgi:hypothetical protein